MPLAHASRITVLIALLISVLANPNFTVTGFQVVPSFLFTCWCGTLSRSFFQAVLEKTLKGVTRAKADGYRIATSTLGTVQQEAVPVRCMLPDSCIGFLLSHRTKLLPSPRASAKAVADGFCSGNSCPSQPLSASAGPSHGAVWQAGHSGSTTEQDGWEGKTITRHVLSLCSEEASRDLSRGKDQSWIQESTFPRCVQQLQRW